MASRFNMEDILYSIHDRFFDIGSGVYAKYYWVFYIIFVLCTLIFLYLFIKNSGFGNLLGAVREVGESTGEFLGELFK